MMSRADCIFCLIATGKRVGAIVYQDANSVAFMNQRQANSGHVLVIPRFHVTDIYHLEDKATTRLMQTVVKVAKAGC